MEVEKLKFLLRTGRIHIFQISDINILYSRENNHTYQIDGDIYTCLNSGLETGTHALSTIDDLFNYTKRDLKPTINFYTLNISNGIKLNSNLKDLIETFFAYAQAEMVFNESDANFDEQSFQDIVSSFKHIGRSDLVIIREKDMLNFDLTADKEYVDKNDMIKIIYDVNNQTQKNISDLTQLNGYFNFEYEIQQEEKVSALFSNDNNYINFYSRDKSQTYALSTFLLNHLNDTNEINEQIYNIYSIANFLTSRVVLTRTIASYDGAKFHDAENQTCNNCWAKNICRATKSFASFGINLHDIENFKQQCDAIRNLIEHTIVKLRVIENRKKIKPETTYDFEGLEIKLIN